MPRAAEPRDSARKTISLEGQWLFQTDGATGWKTVQVPCEWEKHEGAGFDGAGMYQRTLGKVDVPPGMRALLLFEAGATAAEVFWNGKSIGSHLGCWTPFRFDVTELVRTGGDYHEIQVKLAEKVGHNTQGFLPIIQPHFGGLWKSVRLEIVPEIYIDDLQVLAHGNPTSGEIEVELPIKGAAPAAVSDIEINWRVKGESAWKLVTFKKEAAPSARAFELIENRIRLKVQVERALLWDLEKPNLYELKATIHATEQPYKDTVQFRAAFREVEADGTRLLLNGRPLNVRGVLNWGYYPPHLAPIPTEDQMRNDLAFVRENGFNLMKFCLWVPPRRFLELADEMGVLTWMEYPTWHPQLTGQHLEDLRREFSEFFYYDRNHPSIVLRSLTCETGSSADLKVVQSLYDQAKRMIPGALVEDDSSWIAWNRVSDFYDDHPYGNNHTWVETLRRLNEYVAKHTPKPLVLGEAIAADTWPDWQRISELPTNKGAHWLPKPLHDAQRWLNEFNATGAELSHDQLRQDSLHYAMLMRKYQAETFRREVPTGGYVISVIRDIPTASMGLLDYSGQPKWNSVEWTWQADSMLLLKTPRDQRSFFGGENFEGSVLLSHFGCAQLERGVLITKLVLGEAEVHSCTNSVSVVSPGALLEISKPGFKFPAVTVPTRAIFRAQLQANATVIQNQWPIWLLPPPSFNSTPVWLHASINRELAKKFFSTANTYTSASRNGILVASRFDHSLASWLENGGRVLMLPDGSRDSLPMRAHWFLRGAPVISFRPRTLPRDLLLELQHFDLSSKVIPEIQYLDQVDPILALWDTHDRTNVVNHGLVFETRVGRGKLLVSALAHDSSPAGAWLLAELLSHLASDHLPHHTLRDETWLRIKQEMDSDELNLAELEWDFQPGRAEEEQLESEKENSNWKKIRVGRHWEAERFQGLDRWATYRLRLAVPEKWKDHSIFLTFTGVDDLYELSLNGKLFAARGDIATKQSTFSETYSHDLTRVVRSGEQLEILVRVYDWFGAGGIFRPVFLGTTSRRAGGDILSKGQ